MAKEQGPRANEITKIVNCIKQGRPMSVCCRANGISAHLMNKWLREGTDPSLCRSTMIQRFAAEISEASAIAEMEMIDAIKDHAPHDWRAADRVLKIQNPAEYNEEFKIRAETVATVTHKIELDTSMLGELLESMNQYAGDKGIISGVNMKELSASSDEINDLLDDIIDADIVDEGELEEA